MRKLVFTLALGALANGQSMVEGGAVLAGTTIGSAAGKKLSDGANKTLKKTGGILDAAAKTGDGKTKSTAPATPMLQVGAGVPKADPPAATPQKAPQKAQAKKAEPKFVETNNVPPPPPRQVATKPVKSRPMEMPVVMSAVQPVSPAPPFNVDLAQIHDGMARDAVLALGIPSARITMFEDGHLVELYQYRNPTLASGTVRLRDGSVAAVLLRP